MKQLLLTLYELLSARYGPMHWWPAQTRFEIIVGAILTQSAAWVNVEKAINNLQAAGKLSAPALREIPSRELAQLIYPSGYYNAKAVKLKAFAEFLGEYSGDDLDRLFAEDTQTLRTRLLTVHGVGPETADSILLYAGNKPIFVIDAYTRRIAGRTGIFPGDDGYDAYQMLFMDNLPHDAELFNEYHALLVQLGKDACRKKPLCEQCCLNTMCELYCGTSDSR